jgi:hypothetical protein
MLEANTVSQIVALRPQLGDMQDTLARPGSGLAEVAEALADLGRVADTLRDYERAYLLENKTAHLAQANKSLRRLEREVRVGPLGPERHILGRIVANWLALSVEQSRVKNVGSTAHLAVW